MAHKYGVATGQAYDLARIQAHLPIDAALLTWVDVEELAKAADPNGEHWAWSAPRVRPFGCGSPAPEPRAIGQHRPKPDQPTRGSQTVVLAVWREGQTLELTAAPGPLGVVPSKDSAAEGIRARREGDALLRGLRGNTLPSLPGSRTEVQAIARLFPQAEMLLGSDASEQRLDDLVAQGRLRQYRYLHFATHGLMNDRIPLQSSLALAQDHLPDPLAQVLAGKRAYDGRLTADQILQTWKLDADLVTLSACDTGLGRQGGGDGYIGFAQVLFLAGARSLVLSLWEVDDRATALLMVRFYQNLLGKRDGLTKPLPKAEALAEAKRWLRGLSRAEVERLVKALPNGTRLGKAKDPGPVVTAAARPFAHPYYWSAFILIGDPQ